MSERINTHDNRATIRWKLLTGASALALTAYVSSVGVAKAEDTTHPLIWLELDGQFAQQMNGLEVYSPPFLASSPFDGVSSLAYEKTRPYIWDKSGKISFQPEGSDWILSASIRFGKSGRAEKNLYITPNPYVEFYGLEKVYRAYQDTQLHSSESHTIIDFMVGKDVGLGRFGSGATSTVNLGVRFAQFRSTNHAGFQSQPTNHASYGSYNRFYASFDGKRRFEGLGPSLSWNASATIAGNSGDGGISLDWGVNGAVLFGRQKMSERHQTTKQHFAYHSYPPPTRYTPVSASRNKKVTVTNLGGFAGISWRYAAAKVTMGYRVDEFFNVLDGGIATAKQEDRAFYGPFASISIGIGD
jgi:hypothetical protein